MGALKSEYPHIPVIGFPRGARQSDYEAYAAKTGVDVVGLDQSVDISFAKENKETAELYLQQLVDCGIHHSFLNADEKIDRQATTKEQVLNRFAKLKA